MIKKISLFVSMTFGLFFSFRLLPAVILFLSAPSAIDEADIVTVITFLFSAPILVIALVTGIKSLRRRVYERFAIWFNFFGVFTIGLYQFAQLIPSFQALAQYGSFDLVMISIAVNVVVSLIFIIGMMIFACFASFLKDSERTFY